MKEPFSPRQRILLWLACSTIFFEAFDVSVVNLSLPLIATDLGIPLAAAQWVQTLYLLSFGGFLLLGGRLCDYAGSRIIFLVGMSLFGAASGLCFAAHHLWSLVPGRVGQGIGAALAMPAGISLLSRYFTAGGQQQTAFGIFGAFAAVGFAGGLALGGMIATLFNWHWIFGINVPVIAGVLAAGYRFIPRPAGKEAVAPNGWMAAWLTATLLLFSYAIHEAVGLGWWTPPVLALALVSGIALYRVDRQKTRPFFGSGVYPHREAWRGLSAFTLLGAAFLPFVFTCTLSLYTVLQRDILATGLLLFPYSIGSALVSKYVLPVLFRRMKVVKVGLLCIGLLLAGDLLLMAGITSRQESWWLVALLLVNSISIAIGYPAFTVLSLTGVPPERQGIAAGIQSTLYTVGSGLGLSLTGLCLSAGAAPGALLASCGIIGGLCLAALIVLLLKSKKCIPLPPV